MNLLFDRRRLLGASLAVAAAPGLALAQAGETVTLPVQGRQSTVQIWRPAAVKGVVLFSHGAGGDPLRYAALFSLWRDAGLLVAAPVHTDSQKHEAPDRDLRAAFGARIADMSALSVWAGRAAPDAPTAVAGHSYGGLIAMVRGGALEARIHARDAAAKAVVAFSTPGVLPSLVVPTGFATLDRPTLTVTGDADLVPGFVSDWHDHLIGFDNAPPGAQMAWIGKGADHALSQRPAGDAQADAARSLSLLFLKANLLDDAAAKTQLGAATSSDLAELRRR